MCIFEDLPGVGKSNAGTSIVVTGRNKMKEAGLYKDANCLGTEEKKIDQISNDVKQTLSALLPKR